MKSLQNFMESGDSISPGPCSPLLYFVVQPELSFSKEARRCWDGALSVANTDTHAARHPRAPHGPGVLPMDHSISPRRQRWECSEMPSGAKLLPFNS